MAGRPRLLRPALDVDERPALPRRLRALVARAPARVLLALEGALFLTFAPRMGDLNLPVRGPAGGDVEYAGPARPGGQRHRSGSEFR